MNSSSPDNQLLEKLVLQQESSHSIDPSPLILFQYSCHVSVRETAATPGRPSSSISSTSFGQTRVQQQQQQQQAKAQAEADLYRHAKLRTPAENAKRSLWGGPLWMEHLTRELLRHKTVQAQQKQQQQKDATLMVWASTTTRPFPGWLLSSQQESPNVAIVSASPLYEKMFLDNKDNDSIKKSHPLAILLEQIQSCQPQSTGQNQASSSPPVIVLESLTPLVQLFGFPATFQFVRNLQQTISRSLILVPVLTETMSTRQHQTLEDVAHTVLWLSNHTGQVDLHVLRRGIREQDSTVREIWGFSLVPQSQQHYSSSPFRLVVGQGSEGDDENKNDMLLEEGAPPDQVNLLQAMNPALNPDLRPPASASRKNTPVTEVTRQTKKITLQLEEDNAPSQQSKSSLTTPTSSAVPKAPRFFLQDDDFELEDYDEEDPDDDLDI